jgi:hypothetical protein
MKNDKQIEEMIIDTLESSGPGKLGMIPFKLLDESAHKVARDMESRGIIEILVNPVFAEVGEVTVIRMAGRIYPTTEEEVAIARNDPKAWEELKKTKTK